MSAVLDQVDLTSVQLTFALLTGKPVLVST